MSEGKQAAIALILLPTLIAAEGYTVSWVWADARCPSRASTYRTGPSNREPRSYRISEAPGFSRNRRGQGASPGHKNQSIRLGAPGLSRVGYVMTSNAKAHVGTNHPWTHATPDDATGTYVVRPIKGGAVLFDSRDESEAKEWMQWFNMHLSNASERTAVYFEPDRPSTIEVKTVSDMDEGYRERNRKPARGKRGPK